MPLLHGGDMRADERRRLVVVGHGMVAPRLVEALVARDLTGVWHITVLAEEPRPAYDRMALSSLFAGTTVDELTLGEPAQPGAERAQVLLGDPVVAVDRAECTVTTESGSVHG